MQDSQSISLIWFCHVPHILESRPTYEWVMSTIWSSHVPHMNMSCLTYECVTSHIWTILSTYEWVMSHVERVMSHIWIKTCPTYERVVSHIWSSRVTHMNQTCPVYEWFVSHICMNYVSHIESCPSHVPQNNESYTNRIPHEWVVSHMRMNSISHIYVKLIQESYPSHKSKHVNQTTPSRPTVFRNSRMSHVPQIPHMNPQSTCSISEQPLLTNESRPTCKCFMFHIWTSHVPRMNESSPTYKSGSVNQTTPSRRAVFRNSLSFTC